MFYKEGFFNFGSSNSTRAEVPESNSSDLLLNLISIIKKIYYDIPLQICSANSEHFSNFAPVINLSKS